MSQIQQTDAIIKSIERVIKYHRMFFMPSDGTAATNFVNGLTTTAWTLGVAEQEAHWQAWREAVRRRGWEQRGTGPMPEMAERGMSNEQIAEEVLAIALETWRILRGQLPDEAG